ncbi:MAG: DEAD/DEAH box helicase [Fusobacteriaceae bacterium]|nr:DEAD/DEAH box helicase [Fusobacteriaceae bacterium]
MEKIEKLVEFKNLGLTDKTLKALAKKGYEKPSPIQELTIPALLLGDKDIIGQAQTGTGKTAAFSLPIIENIDENGKNIQAIVLTPTRELAVQVSEEMHALSYGRKIRVAPVYGGQSMEFQIKQLKKGVDVVVGTPGRVMDLMGRGILKIDNLKFFVLDEADEMLNMGFVEDIEKILESTNEDKKMLFFSATMAPEILKIAKNHMKEHEILSVKARELTTDLTDQIYFEVKDRDKFEALCRIMDLATDFYGIVFCRTKNDVNELVGKLNDRGYDAEGLHGDISQNHREVTLKRFKNKKLNVLVATDVAARGIDVNDLSHVINYAIPQEAEAYVHRIGRTGRAGKKGTAITFITPSEYRKLMYIQKIVKTEIRQEKLPRIKDIIEAKKGRIMSEIDAIIENGEFKNFDKMTNDLLLNSDPHIIIAALLKNAYDHELDESNYSEISVSSDRRDSTRGDRNPRDSRDSREPRERRARDTDRVPEEDSLDTTGKVRLFIAIGKKDGITLKKLLDKISKKANVAESKIRNVELYENFSFVSVPFKEAEIIIDAFEVERTGKKPLIEKAKENKKR